ncbi:MAG: hypothetical protein ACJAYR_001158 [Sneathiella sp.]|jgi:hypothetical protein
MSLLPVLFSSVYLLGQSSVLTEDFGILLDIMPNAYPPQEITKRDFYQRHKGEGTLPPLGQSNSSTPTFRAPNRFMDQTFTHGSTLPPVPGMPFPRAPSRFSRPR